MLQNYSFRANRDEPPGRNAQEKRVPSAGSATRPQQVGDPSQRAAYPWRQVGDSSPAEDGLMRTGIYVLRRMVGFTLHHTGEKNEGDTSLMEMPPSR